MQRRAGFADYMLINQEEAVNDVKVVHDPEVSDDCELVLDFVAISRGIALFLTRKNKDGLVPRRWPAPRCKPAFNEGPRRPRTAICYQFADIAP